MNLVYVILAAVKFSALFVYRGLAAIGGLVAVAIGVTQFGYGCTTLSPFHMLVGACVAIAGGQAAVSYFGAVEDEAYEDEDEEEFDFDEGIEEGRQRHASASAAGHHRGIVGGIQEEPPAWCFDERGDERAA